MPHQARTSCPWFDGSDRPGSTGLAVQPRCEFGKDRKRNRHDALPAHDPHEAALSDDWMCLSQNGYGRPLEASWSLLGTSCGLLWPSWGSLGDLSGPTGVPLGPSWGSLGPSWSPFGPSWSALGGLLGRPGAALGASWAVLDAVKAEHANLLKIYVSRKG